jgi:phage terminase Nu1 subunit (DNA packaging protein)
MKLLKTKKRGRPIAGAISQADMAAIAGVTVKTLLQWRKLEAIDITDKAAVLTRAAVAKRKEPANPAPSPADGESYSEARRRRAVADADKAEVIARRESGSVIEVADVEEIFSQLGAEMRSRLLSWVGNLPPQLEGLDACRIQAVMRDKITELLEGIHKNSTIKKP